MLPAFNSELKIYRGIIILASILFALIYLVNALQNADYFSLPLDDSYIHLQLAKTFSETGQLGLHSDVPGGGSSSLIWSLILTIFSLLNVNLEVTAIAISAVAWIVTLFLLFEICTQFFSLRQSLIIALLAAFSGHGIATALSGIEASLALSFSITAFYLLSRNKVILSLIFAVLAAFTRPEMSLIALIFLFPVRENQFKDRKQQILLAVVTFGSVFISILILRLISGSWPITLTGRLWLIEINDAFWVDPVNYLKIIWNSLLLLFFRFTRFIGPGYLFGFFWGVIILIALFYGSWRLFKDKKPVRGLIVFLWAHSLFYIIIMPTSGQFGRYLLPLWSLMFIPVVAVLPELLTKIRIPRLFRISILVLLIITYIPQYNRWNTWYSDSVCHLQKIHFKMASFIDSQMPKDTSIAAVDIGILSYKSNRVIIDTGGLSDQKMLIAMKERKVSELLDEYGVSWIVIPEGRLNQKWAFAERLGLNTEKLIELEFFELGTEHSNHFMPTHVAFPAMGLYRKID